MGRSKGTRGHGIRHSDINHHFYTENTPPGNREVLTSGAVIMIMTRCIDNLASFCSALSSLSPLSHSSLHCRLLYLLLLAAGSFLMAAMLTPSLQHQLQSAFKGQTVRHPKWCVLLDTFTLSNIYYPQYLVLGLKLEVKLKVLRFCKQIRRNEDKNIPAYSW